jgi:hypothetical protein
MFMASTAFHTSTLTFPLCSLSSTLPNCRPLYSAASIICSVFYTPYFVYSVSDCHRSLPAIACCPSPSFIPREVLQLSALLVPCFSRNIFPLALNCLLNNSSSTNLPHLLTFLLIVLSNFLTTSLLIATFSLRSHHP